MEQLERLIIAERITVEHIKSEKRITKSELNKRLFCPKYPVAGIAEPWYDVPMLIEYAVHGAGKDFHIWMLQLHFLDSRRS